MTQTETAPLSIPGSVRLATRMLFATLALGLVRAYLEQDLIAARAEGISPTLVIVVQAFVLSFLLLIIWLISRRKNWARWLFSVVSVVGMPFAVPGLLRTFTEQPASAVLGTIQLIVQIVAIVLLFRKPAREWFRAGKA